MNLDSHIRHTHLKEYGRVCPYPLCRRELSTPAKLRAHIVTHLPPERREKYECPQCGKGFMSQDYLRQHSRIHSGQKFKCPEAGCDKDFTFRKYLKNHLLKHSNLRPYTCPDCGKGFCQRRNMKTHIRDKHQNEDLRIYQCHLCGAAFKTKYVLQAHEVTHVEEDKRDRFTCPQCSRSFLRANTLKRHVRQCHSARAGEIFNCTFPKCENKLSSARGLQDHLRRVHGQLRIICYFCGSEFRTNIPLVVHVRTHTTEQPYSCSICGKTFACPSSWRGHKEVHNPGSPMKCPYCPWKNRRKYELKNHVATKHLKVFRLRCNLCGEGFNKKDNLEHHIRRTHTTERPCKCPSCPFETWNMTGLRDHVKGVHGVFPKCYFCGKRVKALALHMTIHTKENVFKCKYCGYVKSTNYRMHMRAKRCANCRNV